jgi:hypothetical protein
LQLYDLLINIHRNSIIELGGSEVKHREQGTRSGLLPKGLI